MVAFELDSPLGSYEDWDEYQIGKTLIYVRHNSGCSNVWDETKEIARDKANQLLPNLFEDRSRAIAIARVEARQQNPELWEIYETADVATKVFAVWDIRILPFLEIAQYDVGANFDFWGLHHADFPPYDEDLRQTFQVLRNSKGQMTFQREERGFLI